MGWTTVEKGDAPQRPVAVPKKKCCGGEKKDCCNGECEHEHEHEANEKPKIRDGKMRKDQFVHYRFVRDGEILSGGGMTVAYVPQRDLRGHKIWVSFCVPSDNFSKADGRRRCFKDDRGREKAPVIQAPDLLSMEQLVRITDEWASNFYKRVKWHFKRIARERGKAIPQFAHCHREKEIAAK